MSRYIVHDCSSNHPELRKIAVFDSLHFLAETRPRYFMAPQ